MLSNRITAALFGAGALLFTGLAVAPANAAPAAAGTSAASTGTGLIEQVQYYGRPYYGPRRHYGRPVYRPRCYFVDRRVWNGYRWVIRPVRVCR